SSISAIGTQAPTSIAPDTPDYFFPLLRNGLYHTLSMVLHSTLTIPGISRRRCMRLDRSVPVSVRQFVQVHVISSEVAVTSILTNAGATFTVDQLRAITSTRSEKQQQVATGLRVQTAADNSAYWSIATMMRSDNR